MYVSTFLELHTTLLGWMLYNVIFGILWETGLLMLPFLWMLLRNSAKSLGEEQEGSHETAVLHVKSTVAAIVVLMTCMVPLYNVEPSDVKFQPPKQVDGTVPGEVSGVTDPTTYADHFGTATASVRIPAWWLLLHNLSSGITHAVIESLPAYSDLREAKMLMATRNIEDPALGAEYRDFYLGCYMPAKRNYEVLRQQGLVPAAGEDAQLDWPGSPYLISMRGGYAACGGDPWCEAAPRPLYIQQSPELASRVGGSTCGHWWQSIRTRLLEYARQDQGTVDKIFGHFKWGFGIENRQEQEDMLVRGMLENFQASQTIAGTSEDGNFFTGAFSLAGDALASAGLSVAWVFAELFLNTMKQVMPILAAMMLMLVVIFIPFALLFSSFSIGAVLNLSFLVFSLIFVQAILAMVGWFDNHLIQSMTASEGWFSFVGLGADMFEESNKKIIINLVLATLYMFGPVIWLAVMNTAGLNAAQAASGLFRDAALTQAITGGIQAAGQAAQKGGISATSGAAAGAASKGIGKAGDYAAGVAKRYRLVGRG